MFLGYFTSTSAGKLVLDEGMMNSIKYFQILQDKMMPSMQMLVNDASVFQHELAKWHNSKNMKNCKRNNELEVLDWSGNTPAVNPIKILLSILKRCINTMYCSTKRKMIENVIQICYRHDDIKNTCSTLLDSMPKRV